MGIFASNDNDLRNQDRMFYWFPVLLLLYTLSQIIIDGSAIAARVARLNFKLNYFKMTFFSFFFFNFSGFKVTFTCSMVILMYGMPFQMKYTAWHFLPRHKHSYLLLAFIF